MDLVVSWLAGVPSFAVPYALAALGLIVSERAGVLSLAAEGLMLAGALAGVGSMLTFPDQPVLAMVAAMAAASLLSLLFAVLVVYLRVNQVIAGLALVFFGQGLTNLLGTSLDWANHTITGIGPVDLSALSDLPVAGPILFTHDWLVYLTPLACWLIHHLLYRTNVGLRLRAVGESPETADSAGVPVNRVRLLAIAGGAALIGLAGAYLSVVTAKIWIAGMTSGRGWIAVALVIFARWNPYRALLGALLFGGIEALIPQVAAAGIRLPQYYLLMAPYLATLLVMVWQRRGSRSVFDEPEALGLPYIREERT